MVTAAGVLIVLGTLPVLVHSDSAQGEAGPCATGSAVVHAEDNPGLVSDCNALLASRDTLAGTATLNWSANTPIDQWEGVVLDGSPLRVSVLDFFRGGLTGEIPPQLGNLTRLRHIWLEGNRLSGEIPAGLGKLGNLESLWLQSNNLRGEIPEDFAGLSSLSAFLFHNNSGLCAPVNAAFQSWLQGVSTVYGSSCSSMDSPEDKAVLLQLYTALDGSNWKIETNWLSDRPIREWYGVTNDANGRITGLYLSSNMLRGRIPTELGTLSNLYRLDLSTNRLTGQVPRELGNLSNLREMLLNENSLEGEIPPEFGKLSNLQRLELDYNNLTGEIPAVLSRLPTLWSLNLASNQLTGLIPAELGDVANLEWLSLANNQLTGEVPAELGKLAKLRFLTLGANQLTGRIPIELGGLENLAILSLPLNQLTGEIPVVLGMLANLHTLSLHSNQLVGEIPAELGNLSYLDSLYLHNNQLVGEIPVEFGNLSSLNSLYLNDNQLTGKIPEELGGLKILYRLFLGNNRLTGCTHQTLRAVEKSDLYELGLPFCDVLLSDLSIHPGLLIQPFDSYRTDYTIAEGQSRVTVVLVNDHDASFVFLDEDNKVILDANDAHEGYRVDFSSELPAINIKVVSSDARASNTYTITDLGIRYDTNNNGALDRDEVVTAIRDYFGDVISSEEVIALIKLYFSS